MVAGNDIGTTPSGSAALANGGAVQIDGSDVVGAGVVIEDGASNNLLGTSGQSADDAGERNIISGNTNGEVDLYGTGTTGNVIAGNLIGTNAAGRPPSVATATACGWAAGPPTTGWASTLFMGRRTRTSGT